MKKPFDEARGLNHVSKFHEAFNLPVVNKPAIPSKERCKLRVNLLEEELGELKEAIEDGDLIEVADALCDLQYVLSGAIHEFGLGHIFSDLFDEVQRSNMSKLCRSREEAEATLEWYKEHRGTDGRIVERDGHFLVYRTRDGKVLKSINYSPAQLKHTIEGK